MLRVVGQVACECDRFEMPLVVIAYPRRRAPDGADEDYRSLLREEPAGYASLLRHTVRAAAELGADVIKTRYSGSVATFGSVVRAAMGVPVVVAGGPGAADEPTAELARACVLAGAAGVCFGRRVFASESPSVVLAAIRRALRG